jgi:hypothetical protein
LDKERKCYSKLSQNTQSGSVSLLFDARELEEKETRNLKEKWSMKKVFFCGWKFSEKKIFGFLG